MVAAGTQPEAARALRACTSSANRHDFARRIERGEIFLCSRCDEEIGADQEWELDHDDRDPSQSYPSHRWCNRSAPNRNVTSRKW